MSQFHPQSAGLSPNKKLGGMYGGMWNFIPSVCSTNPTAPTEKKTNCVDSLSDATGMGGSPYDGPAVGMGTERASPKYGECLLS